jgi:DNA-binding NarL/FixJ family response regulator
VSKNGYPTIAICVARRRKKFTVHRLVAEAFCEGYSPELTVNHINGVKTDNRAENLEWVSLAKNTQLQWDTGLVNLRGDNHPSRKLSARKVRIIRRLLSLGATKNEIAELASVSFATVSLISQGKRWQSVISREDLRPPIA